MGTGHPADLRPKPTQQHHARSAAWSMERYGKQCTRCVRRVLHRPVHGQRCAPPCMPPCMHARSASAARTLRLSRFSAISARIHAVVSGLKCASISASSELALLLPGLWSKGRKLRVSTRAQGGRAARTLLPHPHECRQAGTHVCGHGHGQQAWRDQRRAQRQAIGRHADIWGCRATGHWPLAP